MPIPALRADGLLPVGAYDATLDEVFAAFPAVTARRQALNSALAACVAAVRQARLASKMLLDGSYISNKPDPSDVDMALLTPGVYQSAGEQLSEAHGIELDLLDIQFAHDLTDFLGWQAFFSIERNNVPKGVITVDL